ncbi:FGGY-family carbohydrate kinase [uncultured Agrococcus sp.]|uniref:FGGY-family carbohydrate kinase n=1 Tax=uncultured Agrococcus sp. TaxID=382258 RepID=UPI0025FB3143|nr:FGGY-family carbohydrate kinase [uncultured Agrococcus sp.]
MLEAAHHATIGVDVGTSSTKGVLTGLDGTLIAQTVREHTVDNPRPGHFEHDAGVWWQEFISIAHELGEAAAEAAASIVAVGVSGMGPCVLLADSDGEPVRRAILYGVDSRAGRQIEALNRDLGEEEIVRVGGTPLTSQAAGPKIQWIRDREPQAYARASRFLMPASYLALRLTGEYVLDHHSASQSWPLYDIEEQRWHDEHWQRIAPGIEQPELKFPSERAGTITARAAHETGLREGIPVITGTIDAWNEAVSAGATEPGDLMLMYGTTMFLITTSNRRAPADGMWTTRGVEHGTYSLAGGMATSGSITSWIRDLTGGAGYTELTLEAAESGPGARGLLMLPYFAGERTPVQDPDARGTIVGLTLSTTRGDLYRAALEATAFGVRHNIAAMRASGTEITRVVAVGGGTTGGLWTQIVSDVTGMDQVVNSVTLGASFGAAFLAAGLVAEPDIRQWNPPAEVVRPNPAAHAEYSELFERYLELYPATKTTMHWLAARATEKE